MPPVGCYFRGLKSFPGKQEYLDMLQAYKEELLEEIKEVEMEIEEISKNS